MNVSCAIAGPTSDVGMPAKQLGQQIYEKEQASGDGDAALAPGPIAGGHVVQNLRQVERIQFRFQVSGVVIVGKQILDAGEARLRGGFEAIHEVDFVEQHGQVGAKLRHR